jgi:hypothetical protein
VPTLTSQEARELAARRHSIDAYINSIVKRWPEVTEEQKSRLAQLLKPGVRRSDGEAA